MEGILEGVLGVLAVARNVEGDLKQLCSVRTAEGFERVRGRRRAAASNWASVR
jgi:hypothetical protein